MKSFNQLMETAKGKKPQRVVVAAAHDEEVLQAIKDTQELGIVEGALVGDSKLIHEEAEKIGLILKEDQVYHETDPDMIAKKAVQIIRDEKGDMLMKGLIQTPTLIKAVLHKESGLRTDRVLSHVTVLEVPGFDKLFFVTDAGINIAPDLYRKVDILNNAVQVAHAVGLKQPKTAAITAIENINEDMKATIDAANLSKMAERGQIKGTIVDGPLALDLAISQVAVKQKKVKSPVAGDADILLVPYIEVGNALMKSMMYFAKAQAAGVVMGAKVPIILMSRSDTHETKMHSIALAQMVAGA